MMAKDRNDRDANGDHWSADSIECDYENNIHERTEEKKAPNETWQGLNSCSIGLSMKCVREREIVIGHI